MCAPTDGNEKNLVSLVGRQVINKPVFFCNYTSGVSTRLLSLLNFYREWLLCSPRLGTLSCLDLSCSSQGLLLLPVKERTALSEWPLAWLLSLPVVVYGYEAVESLAALRLEVEYFGSLAV